ncbi:MAG: hypothetical protein WB048_06335, partial [Pseudolabrys sp.]
IERTVTAFARSPNGGLIVTASAPAIAHRDLIVMLAARHKMPTIYFQRVFVTAGRHRLSSALLAMDPRNGTETGSS